jgi:hypothetical protein
MPETATEIKVQVKRITNHLKEALSKAKKTSTRALVRPKTVLVVETENSLKIPPSVTPPRLSPTSYDAPEQPIPPRPTTVRIRPSSSLSSLSTLLNPSTTTTTTTTVSFLSSNNTLIETNSKQSTADVLTLSNNSEPSTTLQPIYVPSVGRKGRRSASALNLMSPMVATENKFF